MFNVKISLLYFLLIAFSMAVIMLFVNDAEEEAIADAQGTLQSLPALFDVHKSLRESRLKDFAERLGNSELRARVVALLEFRKEFIRIDRFICSDETGVKCDLSHPKYSAERARIAEQQFGETVFTKFTDQLTQNVAAYHPGWSAAERTTFQQDTRKALGECFGRGSTQCDWRFTYDALRSVLPEMRAESDRVGHEGQAPDIVLVFDAQGVGIAHADNDGWSYRREYSDLVTRLRQFVASHEQKGVVPVYYDLMQFSETGETEYLVALVPIIGPAEQFMGAILVGEGISEKLVLTDRELFETEVTYIMKDKPLASTMERTQYQFLLTSANVNNRLKRHIVTNEDWIGVSIPYYTFPARAPNEGGASSAVPTFVSGVAYGPEYQSLRVVMASKRLQYVGAFATLQRYIPIFGALLFILGVIFFWLLIRNHTKPFETIDQGIHEVINGNFDYQFPFDYKEELPSVMAQSLNLMLAVLLGKPLPEDEEQSSGSWDVGSGGASPPVVPRGAADAGLVIDSKPDGSEPPADLLREPAETYYKRLYGEYRRARAESGSPDEVITYVRFVERLVRSERDLKESLSCKHVRFAVKSRDGKVVLTPYPVA